MTGFEERLGERIARADRLIAGYLPEASGCQAGLVEACRYGVLSGGKRIRPLLMESAYILVSGRPEAGDDALTAQSPPRDAVLGPFMAAMEMMHSASLIHDDLPCMDNDKLRRGRPSTWYRYGEDMGVLAGDALMIYTFETALKSEAGPDSKLRALGILSRKSGISGMTGGQSVDVQLTGQEPQREQLTFIYEHKTAALIEASLMIGGVLAGADEALTLRLEEAGRCIGLAFQIEDDILDITGSEEELGKPIGSDKEQGKYTWASIYGIERAGQDAADFSAHALRILESIGDYPFLMELTAYLLRRRS